ncbi:hypothetical protein V1502_09640 [Bacillus sp. SCS-153A]
MITISKAQLNDLEEIVQIDCEVIGSRSRRPFIKALFCENNYWV